MLDVNERTNKRNADGRTRFVRTVAGHRMTDHKRSDDNREGTADINRHE